MSEYPQQANIDYYADGVQIGKGPGGMIWAAMAGQVVIAGGVLTLYNDIRKNKVIDSAPLVSVDMKLSKVANSAVWVTMNGKKYSVAITPVARGGGLIGAAVMAATAVQSAQSNQGFIAAFEQLSGKRPA